MTLRRKCESTLFRDVGRFSRNRVVLVFDPKYGWLVVGTWLLNGWKMVVEHFAVVESWLEGGMNDGQYRTRTVNARTRGFLSDGRKEDDGADKSASNSAAELQIQSQSSL